MTLATSQHPDTDSRQRFYLHELPIRGEVVHIEQALHTILAQRDYPIAVQHLLGEMLVATALLASTLKIEGRISIQMQGGQQISWAMAECDHHGQLRALAEVPADARFADDQATTALADLRGGVLFINIEPEQGERYQGIVALDRTTLAECLVQYYDLSMQIPTHLVLASQPDRAGGLLIQLLPRTDEDQERFDDDAWNRLSVLTRTLKADELTDLPAQEILYRLYNEEDVRLPPVEPLQFGCTCSRERCAAALQQVGVEAVREMLTEQNPIEMNCQFCNARYQFHTEEALGLFGQHVS